MWPTEWWNWLTGYLLWTASMFLLHQITQILLLEESQPGNSFKFNFGGMGQVGCTSPPTTGLYMMQGSGPQLWSHLHWLFELSLQWQHIINRFLSFQTCFYVIAWLYRFTDNASRNKQSRLLYSSLTLEEVEHDELLKRHHSVYFPKDITAISAGATVFTSSQLHPLHPFMDKTGPIHVGGWLSNSKLSYQQMHSIILCRKSCLTLILVRQLHLANSHAGPTLLLGLLSGRFYVSGARRQVRKISRDCITCQCEYAKTTTQQMGDLPHATRFSTPFARTGTDFAGPLTLRKGHTHKPVYVKAYVCLFINVGQFTWNWCLTWVPKHFLQPSGSLLTDVDVLKNAHVQSTH